MILIISLWALSATSVRAHLYPPGGDCVLAHPNRTMSQHEKDVGYLKDVVCRQKQAPATAVRIGCVGDSITAVGHTSETKFHWPNQLQAILDAKEGPGKYSVTNLGICGTFVDSL